MLRLEQKIPRGVGAARPIRREDGIRRKALERLVVAKHIVEKIIGCFNFIVFCGLVIDDPDPRTDT